jgi:hypothetical protein
MDAKGSDTCYMLERPIVDKFVSAWCVKAAHSNQKFETLLEVGELAYKHAIRWLCELAYIGPTTMAKALDIRAAAMLSNFVNYGLKYEELLVEMTLDCADYTVVLAADPRLAPPRRVIDYISKLTEAPAEAQIAKLAQLQSWLAGTLRGLELHVEATKRQRAVKKRLLEFKAKRAEIKEALVTAGNEVDALYKLERTRLYFNLYYFKDDLYAFKQSLEQQDAKDVLTAWKKHQESVKSKRVPL